MANQAKGDGRHCARPCPSLSSAVSFESAGLRPSARASRELRKPGGRPVLGVGCRPAVRPTPRPRPSAGRLAASDETVPAGALGAKARSQYPPCAGRESGTNGGLARRREKGARLPRRGEEALSSPREVSENHPRPPESATWRDATAGCLRGLSRDAEPGRGAERPFERRPVGTIEGRACEAAVEHPTPPPSFLGRRGARGERSAGRGQRGLKRHLPTSSPNRFGGGPPEPGAGGIEGWLSLPRARSPRAAAPSCAKPRRGCST